MCKVSPPGRFLVVYKCRENFGRSIYKHFKLLFPLANSFKRYIYSSTFNSWKIKKATAFIMVQEHAENQLIHRLSDASTQMTFEEVTRGKGVTKSELKSDDGT